MTAFTETFARIRCNTCGTVYHVRAHDITAVRSAAKTEGWTVARALKNKTIPRVFDACPKHVTPGEGYRKI